MQQFFFCGYESDLLTLEPNDDIVEEFKNKKKNQKNQNNAQLLLPKITTNWFCQKYL